MPGERLPESAPPPRVLVVGCGALGRELLALTRGLPGVDLTCLPAELHNRPERIPEAVAGRLQARGGAYDRVFVAYADCGTGGLLDRMLEAEFEGVERIPGAHCYEFYAGAAAFAALQDEEVGTFYLTDFLARNFERIVWRGLGLADHPELLETYFGNYRRLVYLAQIDDEELVERARAAADRLGLAFEHRFVGLGDLAAFIRSAATVTSGAGTATANSTAALSQRESLGALPEGATGHKHGTDGTAGNLPADRGLAIALAAMPGRTSAARRRRRKPT